MNLFEALKVNGKATSSIFSGPYYMKHGVLHYLSHGKECLSTISATEALGDHWMPYKDPCKHSPDSEEVAIKDTEGGGEIRHELWLIPTCINCGVKLEPTGWREINTGNADNKTK